MTYCIQIVRERAEMSYIVASEYLGNGIDIGDASDSQRALMTALTGCGYRDTAVGVALAYVPDMGETDADGIPVASAPVLLWRTPVDAPHGMEGIIRMTNALGEVIGWHDDSVARWLANGIASACTCPDFVGYAEAHEQATNLLRELSRGVE